MNRLLHNTRLRNKMLLVYFLCIFTPMIVTNAIFYSLISNNVREGRIKDIDLAVEQIKNEFRSQVDDAVGLSSFFYADLKTNEILERNFANTEDYVEAYDDYLRRVLNSYHPVSLYLQNMMIYVNNPTLLNSGNIGYLSDDIRSEDWYRMAAGSDRTQPVFARTKTDDGHFASFSLIRRLDYFANRMSKEKLLKIDFKTIDLVSLFSNLNVQGDMYLINPDGGIEYTTNGEIDWQGGNETAFASLGSDKTIRFVKEYRGVSYLEGWKIAGIVSEDEIVKEVRDSRDFILWSGGVMMIIPTIIILIITRSINLRIIQILKQMKKVKSQSFEPIQGEAYKDEIGQLTLEFNRMILQIKSLIHDVYLAEIQKKSLELERRKAQLNALQSQMNPHFLFNALETIRMRSLLKKERDTAKIIHSMAKFFRGSLTWNKDLVSVKEELEFILCFLDIQKYRFEDKLDCRIAVAPEAHECLVPKMAFLPFVENACIHGIEPLKHGGMIEIRIDATEDELTFTVRDNGIGMDDATVNKLYRYLEAEETMGERIGVQNAIYRTKIIYGEKIRFSLNSRPGEGTCVMLAIPNEKS
ncbi:MAG: sensor histidine kinase [Paenibacillus macerans]|uniref:sensor histidine kinase n=1 Tax=Paenibacillus macerans TaxID=44252 RepID=UPI00291445EE|nr:sensor histidine kinase [Paenibacillus macerans]MDU7473944.1 sensor histidine kinase [Paenibacillus macerans]